MKTDCSPNRLRKYQERLETQRTSRSRVATPDWSMDLNRNVNGKGSFTIAAAGRLEFSIYIISIQH